MGPFRAKKIMRKADSSRVEFERLWDSPHAYRPGGDRGSRGNGVQSLWTLAKLANAKGFTSGDACIVGIHMLRASDYYRSYAKGFDAVVENFRRGGVLTVTGDQMRRRGGDEGSL